MTGFGIYLVILTALGIVLNFYHAGQGGTELEPGTLIFAGIWSTLNLLGIIFWGTGFGI